MKKVLRIEIAGGPGSGKTTLARELTTLLASIGVRVANYDNDIVKPEELHRAAVESLKDAQIFITTKSLARDPVA